MLDGGSYPFGGTYFDLSGDTETTVARSGKPPLTIDMHLNLAAPDDSMTGSVMTSEAPAAGPPAFWPTAPYSTPKTIPRPISHGAAILLSFTPGNTAPTNEPGGYGFATLTNNLAGQVAISDRLGVPARPCQPIRLNFTERQHSPLRTHFIPAKARFSAG